MTRDDVPGMVRMYSQSWIDTYTNPAHGVTREWVEARVEPRSRPENLERLRQLVESADPARARNVVAVSVTGEVIGMARPYRDDEGRVRVGALYVDRARHGQGVGAALMQRIIDWAGPHEEIELHVAIYNDRARSFYRKWGFLDEPDSETVYGGVIKEVCMIRPADGTAP